MGLNIVDITTSMMRSVNKAIGTMSGIALTELPLVSKQELKSLVITSLPGTFTSIIRFDFSSERSRGAMVLSISPAQVTALFGEFCGIHAGSPQAEIADACGEFCNVVAGGFKKEIAALGYGEFAITPPANYTGGVYENTDLAVTHKYKLAFFKDERLLLTVDVALESAT